MPDKWSRKCKKCCPTPRNALYTVRSWKNVPLDMMEFIEYTEAFGGTISSTSALYFPMFWKLRLDQHLLTSSWNFSVNSNDFSKKLFVFNWDSWKILNLSSFKRGKNASAYFYKGFLLPKNHSFWCYRMLVLWFLIFAVGKQNWNSIFCTISKMVWLQKSIATGKRWQ